MKRRTASCPGCGAPVTFGIGSVVAICDFCKTTVAHGDKKVEDFGKVADLVETSTPLRRGLTGAINGKGFTIAGRVQYRHPAGGVWDEWYLQFSEGRWGWLADAQGSLLLTFERRLRHDAKLPSFESLSVGTNVELAGTPFSVYERGTGICATAEGEIPWDFRSGAEHRFIDLKDPQGRVATLEHGTKPRLFVGRQVSIDELNLAGEGWQKEPETVAAGALQLNCPNCAGPLVLRVPDQSLRVTCPNCNSLLDASNGKLSYLKTLKSKESFPIALPLGKEGKLFGQTYTVIGYMRRYATWEGKMFPWNEYLLHSPSVGFRWLVQNDNHWSFVEPPKQPIAPNLGRQKLFNHDGDQFRLYDRGTAFVRYVLGEFYWKVEVGEQVRTADFICPPRMVSFEWSETGSSQEVNISLGTYLTVDEITNAFKVRGISRPWGVGVIQPGPWPGWGVFLLWPMFILFLVMIQAAYSKPGAANGADGWLCFYSILFVSIVPLASLAFRYAFEVNRWQNSDYSPYATE